jgi:hypothetical protein
LRSIFDSLLKIYIYIYIAFGEGCSRRSVLGWQDVYELYGVYPGEAQASALWQHRNLFEKQRPALGVSTST